MMVRANRREEPSMSLWPRYPTLYEINTWVWLGELSRKAGKPVDLGSVPASEWDAIAAYGFDAVWLMGVWQRSAASKAIANQNPGQLADFRRALPDFTPNDNVGSPYAVRGYIVDDHLGGAAGLAVARRELAKRGMRLLLDFVPNHVAPDNPWTAEHPEYFVQSTREALLRDPSSCVEVSGNVIACGKDPYFPAWSDVVQLNAFSAGLRAAVVATLSDIAGQCDGVRCDMAMLLLNSVFERTWAGRVGPPPAAEYWDEVIPAIKRAHTDFIFIAEAYWDLEWELQQHGFDFCYDKRLYDRLEHENAESVRLHLCADPGYQGRLLRFLENHDEPRAAAAFTPAKERAAAVVISTQMGARMFHEGQFEGRKVRLPVFLARRPDEAADADLQGFYRRLLAAINSPVFRDGDWRLCTGGGWPDNSSCHNIVSWNWSRGDEFYLIVVNLSEASAQARVQVPRPGLGGNQWRLSDLLSGATFDRDGGDMESQGLYVDLPAWGCHFLRFAAMTEGMSKAAGSPR
jgi:hypothetical protein